MRFVNRDSISFPNGWKENTERTLTTMIDLPPEERKRIIEKKSYIWRELKDELRKCWYCESRVPNVTYGDVDHFRPKNKVEECPEHPGYWWLAFYWKNFRYSCTRCNQESEDSDSHTSGGKGMHFPLLNETKRCYDPTSHHKIQMEEPILLDPVVPTEPRLITFDLDGVAQPTYTKEQDEKKFARADTSIKLYHLNRGGLVNDRRIIVCLNVGYFVELGNEWLSTLEEDENNRIALKGYNSVIEGLRKLIDDRSEYSAAAKAILRYHGREWKHEWIDEDVPNAP